MSHFGQVVGGGDPQVLEEPQDLATVGLLEPLQQASGRRSSGSAAPAGWAWRWGVGGAAGGEDAVVAVGQARQHRWRQPVGAGVAGTGGLGAGDREPLGQLRGPPLPWLVGDPLKLAQQMRVMRNSA